MTDAPELLPCPFCGGEAVTNIPPPRNRVECAGDCSATADNAVAWNTRAPSPAPDVRELVEAAKEMSRIWKRPYYGGGGTGERNNDISDAVKRIDAALATQEDRDDG